MRTNDVLQMTDTRRLSPQTTSSSGYHSDLSSTNQSPQSIRKNPTELSTNLSTEKKSKKNFSRISSFIRKQYERAKLKLISTKQPPSPPPPPPPVKTCSKATSTTALSNPSELNQNKAQHCPSSIYKQSSFILPVQSIHVPPSKQDSFSRHPSVSQPDKTQVNSHSHRRLVALSNYENISSGHLRNHSYRYPSKPRYSQDYYPYKYLQKNYHHNRSTYVPLSDFLSTGNSAFKPVRSSRRAAYDLSEQISTSDDPCDLEVAQYFHQTPQWSNPNYFDIYKNEMALLSTRHNCTETLC